VADTTLASFTSFDGHRRIACGTLQANALAVKQAVESGSTEPVLTFDDQTGRVVDIDIRGSEADLLDRLSHGTPPFSSGDGSGIETETSPEPRGRGRPKLGVVAREVTLLPRHWDWLAMQPGGASVTLRKLVEGARRANLDEQRRRQAHERAYHFMSAIAGDMGGFEEAARALFANDEALFHCHTDAWPGDVRDHARHLAFGDGTPDSKTS
jgi:hypothetical protein